MALQHPPPPTFEPAPEWHRVHLTRNCCPAVDELPQQFLRLLAQSRGRQSSQLPVARLTQSRPHFRRVPLLQQRLWHQSLQWRQALQGQDLRVQISRTLQPVVRRTDQPAVSEPPPVRHRLHRATLRQAIPEFHRPQSSVAAPKEVRQLLGSRSRRWRVVAFDHAWLPILHVLPPLLQVIHRQQAQQLQAPPTPPA